MRVKKLTTVAPQVVGAYANGETMDAIAKTYGVSKGTVRNCLVSNGAVLRRTGRRKKVTEPVVEEIV
jgi:transposase